MSCLRNDRPSSPVMVTDNRFYLNGEAWVLAREADLYPMYPDELPRPLYVERPTGVPMLSYATSPAFVGLHGRSLGFPSPSQGEPFSIRAELYSPPSGYCSWQSMTEPDSCAPAPLVSKTRPERRGCAGTGSCTRLHLSHPHLCRKIVQKARRALSKLGRKPGSKTCRSSNTVSILPHSDTWINSAQDASPGSAEPSGTPSYELPAGNGIVHGLPAKRVVAEIDSFVRREPQHAPSGSFSDTISPQTSFDEYSGSGSHISTWNQSAWLSPSSTRYSSNSGELAFISPSKRLSELEASSISSGGISPLTEENACEKAVDRPQLDVDVNAAAKSLLYPKQPSIEDSVMRDWDFCASPTSLEAEDGYLDRRREEDRMHALGAEKSGVSTASAHDAAASVSPGDDVGDLGPSRMNSSAASKRSSSDAHHSDECCIARPLCPCHELPMRPDMDLSHLIAGAKRCGVSLDRLIQDDQATLGGRLQSMFALLVEHASAEFDRCDGEMRAALTRTFEAAPTFQAGLKALSTLHAGPPLPSMHELVSLVFMAFSIAILKIDESDLSQYAGVLYVEMASWTEALLSAADKQAFGIFLRILWLPAVCSPSVGPLQLRQFCPFTNRPDWPPLPFLHSSGLSAAVTLRLCQSYIDLIIHAAQNEAASLVSPPDHPLGCNPPPAFVDSALDLMAPYLEATFSEPMREVVSSTMQALRNGTISSFHEIDEHLTSELLNRPDHFGRWGSPMCQHFTAMCRIGAATFANQSVTWLWRTLADSSSRVGSRDGAGRVDPPPTRIRDDISRSGLTPGLSKSPTTRKGSRQKKIPPAGLSSTCPKCGRMFKQKYRQDHLRRHLRSFHSDKYITCQLCGRKLKYRKDNIAKHVRICHPGEGGQVLIGLSVEH